MKPTIWRDAIRDSGLDRSAKLVAHTLSTYMNAAGDTFVGKETVGNGAGLVVRAVDEAINRLERFGYLAVIRSKGGRPNHYIAATPQADAGSTPQAGAGSKKRNPAYRSTQPRISQHRTPHGDAPESAYSAEGVATTDASLDESVPSIAITDNCFKCDRPYTTVDGSEPYCPDCRAVENGAAPVEELAT